MGEIQILVIIFIQEVVECFLCSSEQRGDMLTLLLKFKYAFPFNYFEENADYLTFVEHHFIKHIIPDFHKTSHIC